MTALKKQFEQATSDYDNVNISAIPVCAEVNGTYSIDSWKQIIDNDEAAEELFNIVARSTSNDDNDYNARRYLRIAIAYRFFVVHDDIKSFLCVLNKYPKDNDYSLDYTIIKNISDKIEKYYSGIACNSIELLSSEDFDNEKNRISQKLTNGDKIFVISIYQAIGSGQNLQYKIPQGTENTLVKINGFDARAEKDYDAIYLDNPTNLLVNLHKDITEADFAKYLFQVEFLRERVEISDKVAIGDNKLRSKQKEDELLTACLDIKYMSINDKKARYFVGTIGEGMQQKISDACPIREIEANESDPLFFDELLPLMNITFVRNGQLTVLPFPFKYLREWVTENAI